MLEQLSVENFKCWKRISAMEFAPITGLFGANSSGKTSVLQLLLMLKQTVESPDRAQALIFGGERSPADLGGFKDVIFARDEGLPLRWCLRWRLPKQLTIRKADDPTQIMFKGDKLTFRSEIRLEKGRQVVPQMSYGFAGQRFEMRRLPGKEDKYEIHTKTGDFEFKRTRGRPWELPPPVKCYGFPDQARAYFQNAEFLSDLQLSFEQLFARLFYLGPLREYPHREYTWTGAEPADMGPRGGRVVDALLAAKQRGLEISRGRGKKRVSLEKYVALWLQRLGLIDAFSVVKIAKESSLYRVQVKQSASSPSVLITDVGFGVSQVLPALVLCYYVPEGSTIILEQPEIHLHPSVQAGLADVFVDAVKRRNIQIIVESHSEHLLLRLQRRVAEGAIDSDKARLYFCDCGERPGGAQLTPLKLDDYGRIRNWPKDFFGDRFAEAVATEEAALGQQVKGE